MAAEAVATTEVMTTQQLYHALVKSRLVDEESLNRSLASIRVKHGGQMPADAETVAGDLVAAGLITEWQSTHLLSGRWKGFFLGKYKLIRLLGAGGMGAVYLGEHTVMNKRVAIKVLPKEGPQRDKAVASFQAEARTAAMLDHPNVVRTIDIDEVKGRHFIVMEYVDGSDLHHRVRKSGPLSVVEALDFFRQATNGLQYAHERGVLHRDVKPLNMLITRDGVLKISDLGLARLRHESAGPEKRRVVGTADYIAPEQSRNSQIIDGRADLYSLGCTLYFMLTGEAPFMKGNAAEKIAAHQLAPTPDLKAKRPDCPDELVAIYQRLMAKPAEERYQTASELLAAIDRLTPKAQAAPQLHKPPGHAGASPLPASATAFGSAGMATVGDALFDTSASSGGLSGSLSGSLSGELGDGIDLGALANAAGAAGSISLSPRAAAKPEVSKQQNITLVAGIGLAITAVVISLVVAFWPEKKKPSQFKMIESGGNITIIQSDQ